MTKRMRDQPIRRLRRIMKAREEERDIQGTKETRFSCGCIFIAFIGISDCQRFFDQRDKCEAKYRSFCLPVKTGRGFFSIADREWIA